MNNKKLLDGMDERFEKCIGKYSDSFESGLDVFGKYL